MRGGGRRTFVGLKFEWVWGIIGSDVRGGGADCEILYDVRCAGVRRAMIDCPSTLCCWGGTHYCPLLDRSWKNISDPLFRTAIPLSAFFPAR